MAVYVSLLRGISPLDPRMRNEHLRAVHEQLGFTDVRTVITTGNVVFATARRPVDALASKIERAIEQQLGFTSATFVRTAAQIRELVNRDPFGAAQCAQDGTTCNVTFVERRVSIDRALTEDPDVVFVASNAGALYTVTRSQSAGERRLLAAIDRATDQRCTARAWSTIRRVEAAL